MPELAEVERTRRIAAEVAVGRRVSGVRCADDAIVVDGARPREVVKALTGARVDGVDRRGKYFWFRLDRRPWPLVHLGMAGAIRVPGTRPLRLVSSPREESEEWPPKWWKLLLAFDDGGALAFVDKRRLGRLRLRDDPLGEPPVSQLGFDPLLDLPGPADFLERVRRRRRNVKALLLDQAFSAGVGNWLADEILAEAGVDPRRRSDELAEDEIEAIRRAMCDVVASAVGVDADADRFPEHWIFHRRWSRAGSEAEPTPSGLRREKVAGRTTVWDPSRQS